MEYPKCVHCGYCCMKVQCSSSLVRHGLKDVCPELYKDGEDFKCKIAFEPNGAESIGAGCPGTLFNTQRNNKIAKDEENGKEKKKSRD